MKYYRTTKNPQKSISFHLLCYKFFCDLADPKRSDYHYSVLKKHRNKINGLQVSFILERLLERNQYHEAVNFLTLGNHATPKLQIDAELARVYQFLGKHDEANTILKSIINNHGFDPKVFRLLSATYAPHSSHDPYLEVALRAWENNTFDKNSTVQLGFGISKFLLELEDPLAFTYLNICNDVQSQLYPYRKEADRLQTYALINAQKAHIFQKQIFTKITPVFICSMPRSGTTLLEKMLCEHNELLAGGEIGVGMKLVKRHFSKNGKLIPLNELTPLKIKNFALDFEKEISFRNLNSKKYVIDKSMSTFSIMPYIALAIPNAKFIILHRDIREIALSLYTNFFELGAHRYSNTWEGILFRIRLFKQTICSFNDVIAGRALDVSYSDLVESAPETRKRIFDFLGVDAQGSSGLVVQNYTTRTLSVSQVRNTVNSNSRKKWRVYEDQMSEFLLLLGDKDF